ncbi:hypothetical protein BDF14DRAFT_1820902, partial [Spinellus fusiger]
LQMSTKESIQALQQQIASLHKVVLALGQQQAPQVSPQAKPMVANMPAQAADGPVALHPFPVCPSYKWT